jgi:hypothetical protein
LYCLSLFSVQILTFGHCIVCRCSVYVFWPLVIVLSVVVQCTSSDLWSLYCLSLFTSSDLWSLHCLSLFSVRLLTFGHCIVCRCLVYRFWPLVIVLSVVVQCTSSDLWSLHCLSLFSVRLLTFGHCIVCRCSRLLTFGHCIVCRCSRLLTFGYFIVCRCSRLLITLFGIFKKKIQYISTVVFLKKTILTKNICACDCQLN